MNKNNFERLLANFGFFSQDLVDSLDQSEKDYRAGRVKKITSLKTLSA